MRAEPLPCVQVFSKAPLEYAVFGEGAAVTQWLPAREGWTPEAGDNLQFLTGQESSYTNVRQVRPTLLDWRALADLRCLCTCSGLGDQNLYG